MTLLLIILLIFHVICISIAWNVSAKDFFEQEDILTKVGHIIGVIFVPYLVIISSFLDEYTR